MKRIGFLLITSVIAFSACTMQPKALKEKSLTQRVDDRDYPSIFQAWYGIDMEQYPDSTNEQRLALAAKHDLIWEEPLSQLGEKVDLVLGLVWDHKNHGLANKFTDESLKLALENRKKMLELNPNMVFLFEVRWRDAPMSFLPDDSPFWLRDSASNEIKKGWLGGWEPFYMLNYENAEFQDNVARQCKIALESGVYDGVMFDWSGHFEVIKKTRAAIGDSALIIVNIHDDIHDAELFAPYINGAFMELNPIDTLSMPIEEMRLANKEDVNGREWANIEKALVYYEANFRKPIVNCNEVWGHRQDLARMRAVTTMTLTLSNGYSLYADPNPLKTPDHFHDWYADYDVKLGKPVAKGFEKGDGSVYREFEGGTVVYNRYGNKAVDVVFSTPMTRVSDGTKGTSFVVNGRDGDIFLK